MACIKSKLGGVTVILTGPDQVIHLKDFGADVWMEWHNYLGPTFFRSQHSSVEIRNPSRKTWKAFENWQATK